MTRKIVSICVAVALLFAVTTSINGATTGSFHIDPNNPNSTSVSMSLSLGGTSATATTSMPYGFCTLSASVVVYYFFNEELGYVSGNWGSSSTTAIPVEWYSVSATAYTPPSQSGTVRAVGAISTHGASSPDGSMSNGGTLRAGNIP